jgi:transcriptional regulator with XRE-family HTH domain
MTPADLGRAFRDNRKALKRTQLWVAARAGVRRETIIELESGGNVGLHILMAALSALGKGVRITDIRRPDFEQIEEIFPEG